MINKRKIFPSFFILLCISHATTINFTKSNPDSCCQVIQVHSTGPLIEFYPEHIGSYKRLRSRRQRTDDDYGTVYKHLTNPRSFIFLQGDNWVIGLDYTKSSFVSSWPQKTRTYFRRKGTVFENHQKCRIWIFQFWHFPPIFDLIKLTCLVTLFDRKL